MGGERLHLEERSTFRDPFERDRDRLLYSSAFRRLAGVTQVAAAHERPLLHNRLTHSMKVAQVGRRLAQRLIHPKFGDPNLRQVIDPDVVETAGLAHDLGHPPFGHSAEVVLNDRLKGAGGFEGNAQSFRIVTKLSVIVQSHPGLNLTERTLNSILKYPCYLDELSEVKAARQDGGREYWWDRSLGSKWGAYHSEAEAFKFARPQHSSSGLERYQRSPEAIIMDWADDISFGTHDIDDYFRAGLIPLHDLKRHRADLQLFAQKRMQKLSDFKLPELEQAFDSILEIPVKDPFEQSPKDRESIHAFVNAIMTLLTNGCIGIDEPPWVAVTEQAQYLAEALKNMTRYFVIDSAATSIARAGQTNLVADLYDILAEWLQQDPRAPRLPRLLRSMFTASYADHELRNSMGYDEGRLAQRVVADYICTLTEPQAIDMAQRFNGTSLASMFGSWF